MTKYLIAGLLLTVLTAAAHAQSAAVIDEVLAESQLTYGNAAFLVLGAVGRIDADAQLADAVTYLNENNLNVGTKSADEAITLGEFSLLLISVLEIDGGFIFNLTREPRYAARELAFLGAVQGRAFPGMSISGARGIRILNRTLELREEGRL